MWLKTMTPAVDLIVSRQPHLAFVRKCLDAQYS